LNWGSKVEFYEVLAKKGNLKEDDIRPEINEGESLMINLFIELSPSRPMGMGLGAIPPQVYWEAQKRYGLTDLAVDVLRWLDLEFLRKNGAS
jgi:hypothetical protein